MKHPTVLHVETQTWNFLSLELGWDIYPVDGEAEASKRRIAADIAAKAQIQQGTRMALPNDDDMRVNKFDREL